MNDDNPSLIKLLFSLLDVPWHRTFLPNPQHTCSFCSASEVILLCQTVISNELNKLRQMRQICLFVSGCMDISRSYLTVLLFGSLSICQQLLQKRGELLAFMYCMPVAASSFVFLSSSIFWEWRQNQAAGRVTFCLVACNCVNWRQIRLPQPLAGALVVLSASVLLDNWTTTCSTFSPNCTADTWLLYYSLIFWPWIENIHKCTYCLFPDTHSTVYLYW